jgi:hypothetical protein
MKLQAISKGIRMLHAKAEPSEDHGKELTFEAEGNLTS